MSWTGTSVDQSQGHGHIPTLPTSLPTKGTVLPCLQQPSHGPPLGPIAPYLSKVPGAVGMHKQGQGGQAKQTQSLVWGPPIGTDMAVVPCDGRWSSIQASQ